MRAVLFSNNSSHFLGTVNTKNCNWAEHVLSYPMLNSTIPYFCVFRVTVTKSWYKNVSIRGQSVFNPLQVFFTKDKKTSIYHFLIDNNNKWLIVHGKSTFQRKECSSIKRQSLRLSLNVLFFTNAIFQDILAKIGQSLVRSPQGVWNYFHRRA